MSVINQVLNQLERRGAHTVAEQAQVRAVPRGKRSLVVPLLALAGLALLAGVVAWQWPQAGEPAPGKAEGQSIAVKHPPPASPEDKKIAANEAEGRSFEERPKVTADGVVQAAAVTDTLQEAPSPASRLSFELNSVPLPSSRHDEKTSEASFAKTSDTTKLPQVDRKAPKQQRIQAVAPPVVPAGEIPMKRVSPAQQADAEFRRAVELMQQGRISDAITGYEAALKLDAGHQAARQALVALLLEGKRGADAERVLQEGLSSKPEQTGFAMLLARLQVERDMLDEAMATLEKSLSYADNQADYQAFFAALLQRRNRHKEAVTHYQIALQLAPNNGVWLMGYGISLQAVQRNDEARAAFGRALESHTLSPELQKFVQMKIK